MRVGIEALVGGLLIRRERLTRDNVAKPSAHAFGWTPDAEQLIAWRNCASFHVSR